METCNSPFLFIPGTCICLSIFLLINLLTYLPIHLPICLSICPIHLPLSLSHSLLFTVPVHARCLGLASQWWCGVLAERKVICGWTRRHPLKHVGLDPYTGSLFLHQYLATAATTTTTTTTATAAATATVAVTTGSRGCASLGLYQFNISLKSFFYLKNDSLFFGWKKGHLI